MALFRRSREDSDELEQAVLAAEATETLGAPTQEFNVRVDGSEEMTPVTLAPGGPWDLDEAPQDDLPRLDLGGIRVPIVEGIELNIEASTDTGAVTGVSYTIPDVGMMQISAFAAPKTAGIWDEVRLEIASSAAEAGGTLADHPGSLGVELRGHVPTDQPGQLAPARFIGVDGPRWFARAVISGQPALSDEMSDALLGLFRMCIIVRGDEAMPVRELLTMNVPKEVLQAAEQAAEETVDAPTSADFKPFERGPEITEIH